MDHPPASDGPAADHSTTTEMIDLTPIQRQSIEAAFNDAAPKGVIESDDVGELAQELLGKSLNNCIIDVVDAMTQNYPLIDVERFADIMAAILARTTDWGILNTKSKGPVGLGSLVDSEVRRFRKRGFSFNLMVVGESGLGKTTLIQTLFNAPIVRSTASPRQQSRTTEIHTVTHVLEEQGVRLRLAVTDCPGFGDQVDNSETIEPIVKYIDTQHEAYLQLERAVCRPSVIVDSRVHAVLYFIAPTGHGLKPLDISVMRELHERVNIIPVIAKSDAFTIAERDSFKRQIREDLQRFGIEVFPWNVNEDDAEDEEAKTKIKTQLLPFAVMGATDESTDASGNSIRGRQTPWGFIDVDNLEHSELPLLRDALIREYLADLKESTAQEHYERYRKKRLSKESSELSTSTSAVKT